jgi:hypothetical protein
MRIIVSTNGRIVLPAAMRHLDGIEPGQVFVIERLARGEYRLRRSTRRNWGLMKLLQACPAQDWFCPLDRSETTAALWRRWDRRR